MKKYAPYAPLRVNHLNINHIIRGILFKKYAPSTPLRCPLENKALTFEYRQKLSVIFMGGTVPAMYRYGFIQHSRPYCFEIQRIK